MKKLICSLIFVIPFFGCATEQRDGVDMFFDNLERAHARGHASVAGGGSPLSIGAKQTFFAGPENAIYTFDGDVDFTRPDNTSK